MCQSTRELKAKAWRLLSQALRLEAADYHGQVRCVCCGARRAWNSGDIHAGHFVAGRGNSILLDEENIDMQCRRCNKDLRGNMAEFRRHMIARHGARKVSELIEKRNLIVSFQRDDLQVMCEEYQKRIDEAKEKKGL